MIAGEVNPWFGDQRCQRCDEIHRIEGHPGGAIPVGRLNTLKAVRTIVATHVDAVQEQDMEVDKVN